MNKNNNDLTDENLKQVVGGYSPNFDPNNTPGYPPNFNPGPGYPYPPAYNPGYPQQGLSGTFQEKCNKCGKAIRTYNGQIENPIMQTCPNCGQMTTPIVQKID